MGLVSGLTLLKAIQFGLWFTSVNGSVLLGLSRKIICNLFLNSVCSAFVYLPHPLGECSLALSRWNEIWFYLNRGEYFYNFQ